MEGLCAIHHLKGRLATHLPKSPRMSENTTQEETQCLDVVHAEYLIHWNTSLHWDTLRAGVLFFSAS